MISCNSYLASSQPATSSKVTWGLSMLNILALDLPKLKALLPPPCIWRRKNTHSNRIRMKGR